MSSSSTSGSNARSRRLRPGPSDVPSPGEEEASRASIPERLLALAMEAIEQGGEVAVRVADIAKDAETAITSIYHYFGSRDGLVEAAQIERIVRSYREGTEEFRRGFEQCRSRAEFRAFVLGAVRGYGAVDRASMRLARAHAVGAAFGRPRLAKRVGEFLDRIDADRATVLAEAQRRGWMRDDIDPLAASQWFATLVFGRVLGDLEREAWDPEAWLDVTIRAVNALLFGDATGPGAKVATRARASKGEPPPAGGRGPEKAGGRRSPRTPKPGAGAPGRRKSAAPRR